MGRSREFADRLSEQLLDTDAPLPGDGTAGNCAITADIQLNGVGCFFHGQFSPRRMETGTIGTWRQATMSAMKAV
jgi:hypothetical protein